MSEELHVGELLKNAYNLFSERNKNREIMLPKWTYAEIANDSDWHRTRVGYMRYDRMRLFQINKEWAVGCGEKCGSYPADPYDSDILAFEFSDNGKNDKQISEELPKEIAKSSYFYNSLIYGKSDGMLSVNKDGRFATKIIKILQPEIERFIAQEPEFNREVFSLSTLSPICINSALYKPEFADFLSNAIENVLKSC